MKLLIVRHGLAMEREDFQATHPGANDELRPLTLDGIRKMQKYAKGLSRLMDQPDALIASPLVRAQQTSALLEDVWKNLKTETSVALKPNTSPKATCDWLNAFIETRGATSGGFAALNEDSLIAIVGHEPHLTKTIGWFLGIGPGAPGVVMKKGGACLLEFDGRFAKANARLRWMAPPSVLKHVRS